MKWSDESSLKDEWTKHYGPFNLILPTVLLPFVEQKWCQSVEAPTTPGADVNVLDVAQTNTETSLATGTTTLANSVTDALTPTTTVVPVIT